MRSKVLFIIASLFLFLTVAGILIADSNIEAAIPMTLVGAFGFFVIAKMEGF